MNLTCPDCGYVAALEPSQLNPDGSCKLYRMKRHRLRCKDRISSVYFMFAASWAHKKISPSCVRNGLVAAMIALFQVCSTAALGQNLAEAPSQCSADTVPIEYPQWKMPRVTTLSVAKEHLYPLSSKFATLVTEHLEARLAQEKICLNSPESRKRSLLQFKNWDLHGEDLRDVVVPHLPPEAQPVRGCTVSSPWVDLAVERGPVPWVRGIVRWNVRQVLADQALLAGVDNVPPGVAMILEKSEYERFAWEYLDSEINRKPASKPIEERVPPDLLWLFRHTSTAHAIDRAHFDLAALVTANKAKTMTTVGYAKLVMAMIDRCLAAEDGADIHYSNILKLVVIPLEDYKITRTPIIDRVVSF